MSKNLNKNVADFKYKGRKYEIDLLLDSISNGFQTYDIFDTTNDERGLFMCQITLDEGVYTSSELIPIAKDELENFIN